MSDPTPRRQVFPDAPPSAPAPHRGGLLLWAWFGLAATLLGIGAGQLVASLVNPAAAPVLAVGSTVIDATPTPVKEWAVANFGTKDKPILIGSVFLVVLLLAALGGILARRRVAVGVGLLSFLVVLAGAAALSRPTAGVLDVVPSLVTLVAGVGTLLLLARLRPAAPVSASPAGSGDAAGGVAATTTEGQGRAQGASRRTVLVVSAVVAGSAALMGAAGRLITSLRSAPEDVVLPKPAQPLAPLPAGLEKRFPAISALQTPVADFYRVDTRLDTPVVDLESWTLTIDGDVDQEVSFTFDDLLAMELIERDITLTCVSNSVGGKYVGAARWLGVPLKTLLDKAGIANTKADQILATDFDGMTISTPLDLATDGRDAMVAIGMNGQALPREHGFPARIVIPGLYGFISATKWVTRLTLTTYDAEQAYWTQRDWATDAPIKISTRIDTPRSLAQLDAGTNIIGGVAWAQTYGGIAKIQVRIDGGPWQDAELGPDVGNDYWRQWYFEWDAEPGTHAIAARCIDGDGETQSAARAEPFPAGSSGIQELMVSVG